MRWQVTASAVVMVCLVPWPAAASSRPMTFYRDGGWAGQIEVTSSGGFDTTEAWAAGRHSRATAKQACSGREPADRAGCVRKLLADGETRVRADCTTATTWREGDAGKVSLSAQARAGALAPLDDDKAWSIPLSHRARWAISSWLRLLCPASAGAWKVVP